MASKIDQDIAALDKTFRKLSLSTDALLDDIVEDSAKATWAGAIRSIYRNTEGPGAPPNLDTGELVLRMHYDHEKGSKSAVVYNNDEKSFNLETIWNRPFLRPALKKVKRSYKARIKRRLKAAIKRAENA